ncbi:MAG: branched-chain amino acid ABC transporter permease [Syntrophorhabdales bacterium]|jgi:branched-chain amino acid transport system permease protein
MNKRGRCNAFALGAAAILALLMPVILLHNEYLISVLILILLNVLMASSLRTIALLREVSLGHVGFALIGSYASALLMMKGGLSFWPALLASGLLSAAVALILGYPFLRVRGIYFSILTLLTAETFRLVAFYWRGLTGGTMGLVGIPSPEPIVLPLLGSVSFDETGAYYYLTLVVIMICMTALYLIERSHLGFTWRAIKNGEELSQSVGINVIGYKVVNFAIASFFAGIAGSLFAHYQRNLSADFTSRFGVVTSIYLVVYMVVGGQRNFLGPAIGTIVLTVISEWARPMKEYQPMIIGAIAILVALFMPGGLVGLSNLVGRRDKGPGPGGGT